MGMDEKQKTISQILDDVIQEICDNYCRYPREVEGDAIFDICENCPFNRLI